MKLWDSRKAWYSLSLAAFIVIALLQLFPLMTTAATELKVTGRIPVNGLCAFVAVREVTDSDGIGDLVAQALRG